MEAHGHIFLFGCGDRPRNDDDPDYDHRGDEYTPRACLAILCDDAFPQNLSYAN